MSAPPPFAEVESRVLTLFGRGELDAALGVAEDAARRWPDRTGYTAYWAACIRCALGDAPGALRTLSDALDTTPVWWSRSTLEDDVDLGPIRALPGFAGVVAECERRGDRARATASVAARVLRPAADRFRGAAVVALHGRTGNLDDSAEAWQAAADAGITTVVLQSSQMVGAGMHCWDDLAIAERDVRAGIASALGDANDGVVVAGFSQGGGVATRLALARTPPCRAVVAIAPSFMRAGLTPEELRPLLGGAARAGVRGWLAIGGDDARYRPGAEAVAALLSAAGVPIAASIVDGIGHAFPPDLRAALGYRLPALVGRPSAIE